MALWRSIWLCELLKCALKVVCALLSCRAIVKEVGRPGRVISDEVSELVHDMEHEGKGCGGHCLVLFQYRQTQSCIGQGHSHIWCVCSQTVRL